MFPFYPIKSQEVEVNLSFRCLFPAAIIGKETLHAGGSMAFVSFPLILLAFYVSAQTNPFNRSDQSVQVLTPEQLTDTSAVIERQEKLHLKAELQKAREHVSEGEKLVREAEARMMANQAQVKVEEMMMKKYRMQLEEDQAFLRELEEKVKRVK